MTLNSCPAGILAPPSGGVFQPSTEFWLTGGGGNPEAVLVTSTTCPLQGSASGGNISFVAAYVHIGYTIGSASSGIQEAINAGNFITTNNLTGAYSPQNGAVVIPPGEYAVNARITVLGNRQNIEGSGAILTYYMADSCLFIGDYNNANFTSDVVVNGLSFRPGEPGSGMPSDHFAMIEDNAQHTTIRNIRGQDPTGTGRFDTMLQIDNDESTVIEGLDANSYPSTVGGKSWASCSPSGSFSFCSNIVQGANNTGPAPVISIKNSVLDAECYANGVDLGTGGGGYGAAGTVVITNGSITGVNLGPGGRGIPRFSRLALPRRRNSRLLSSLPALPPLRMELCKG